MANERGLITDFEVMTRNVGRALVHRAHMQTISGESYIDGPFAEDVLEWKTMEEAASQASKKLLGYRRQVGKEDIGLSLLTVAFPSGGEYISPALAASVLDTVSFHSLLRVTAAAFDIPGPTEMSQKMTSYYSQGKLPGRVSQSSTSLWFRGVRVPSRESYDFIRGLFVLEGFDEHNPHPLQGLLVSLLDQKFTLLHDERMGNVQNEGLRRRYEKPTKSRTGKIKSRREVTHASLQAY